MEYTIPEALDIARELFEQEPTLVNEFGKIELHGLPPDPVEAFMFCCWKINSVLKTHEQYASFVVSQTAKSVIVGETDSDSALEVSLDPTDKTITQKMKSIVKMIPVPKLTTSRKVDFYTQTQSTGPPILRPAPAKPLKSPSGITPSPVVAQGHAIPSSQGPVNKSSLSKLAEFFGADSEVEVDKILTNMNPETRAIVERSIVGALGGSEAADGGEMKANGGDDDDDEDGLGSQTKRDSNAPKRAAKLARFFGLPASEDNIGKIRTELRVNSNLNFYRGCMGENVIRVNLHFGTSQFSSSKSLLISNLTTTEECIKTLLTKLGIESHPKHYHLLEVSPDKTQKVLKPEDCPLQIMSKWNDAKSFLLKKADLSNDDDDEYTPQPMKKSQSGKLADFFGVGVLELESSSLLKALDQLEPSGTFYEILGIDNRPDEAADTTSAGQTGGSGSKRSKSRRDTNQVMVKVYLSNRTHKKLSISPQDTVAECLVLMAEQMKVNPRHYTFYELKENAEEKELDGKECLWATVTNWRETKKLLFKKLEHIAESEAESEAPRESVDDEDDMSIFSIDGEVVVHYGPENYIGVSVDGETTTKQVIEHMLGILKEDVTTVDKYGIFEVHENGTSRHLTFDECPLITKLNSLESFKFELKKKEEPPKADEIPRPLESISEVETETAKRSAASKRTIKLAGFFGVDDSKTEVNKMKQMLGNENKDGSLKLTKRKSAIRRGINREGWLEVRRDFEELGKARWQHCWCILNKGELIICLGQRSKNEVVSSEGPQITLPLSNCTIASIGGIKKYAFKIVDQRGLVLEFAANSLQEETEWMNKLKVGSRLKVQAAEQPKIVPIQDPTSTKPAKSLDDFEFLKVIGRGHFGKVLLCAEKETGEVFAIKVLKKSKFMSQKDVRNLQAERRIMKGLRHPFLVGLRSAFQSEDRLYLVMEYVNGGELFWHLSKDGYFKEARARFYGAEILSALTYLHQRGIIYRDLKLENILMDKDGHMKITDFGLCKDELGVGVQTSTLCGTTEYMAPEVLLNLNYGFPVDWWSFGVVLYEMLCGTHPFYSQDRDQLFYNTLHRELRYPSWISDDAVDLLESLLERNPAHRLGSGAEDGVEIMKHPFFKSINFKQLEEKSLPVPYKPSVSGAADTSNIDTEFTKQNPVLTPVEKSHLANVPNFDFMDD